MWTDRPSGFENTWVYQALSLYDALGQIAPEGSEFYLAVFEFNAWIHSFSRALGNANGINALSKYGDIFKIICSANCLQVDGHNDDGWNQGLLFMNNDSSWFQPPAYAMQLAASVRQNNALKTTQDNIFQLTEQQ